MELFADDHGYYSSNAAEMLWNAIYTGESRYIPVSESIAYNIDGQGGQAGPFGGDNPYQLSGIPNIPRIVQLHAPDFASSTEGIVISLSIDPAEATDQP
jgi:hypothetical protein